MSHKYKLSKHTEKQLEALFKGNQKVSNKERFRSIQIFVHHALMPYYDRESSSLKNQTALGELIKALTALGEPDQLFLIERAFLLRNNPQGRKVTEYYRKLIFKAVQSCVLGEPEKVPEAFQDTEEFLSGNQRRLLSALGFDPDDDALFEELKEVLLADPIFDNVKIAAFDERKKGDALFEKAMPEVAEGKKVPERRSKGTEKGKQKRDDRKEKIQEYYLAEQLIHGKMQTKEGLLDSARTRYNQEINPSDKERKPISMRTAWTYIADLK